MLGGLDSMGALKMEPHLLVWEGDETIKEFTLDETHGLRLLLDDITQWYPKKGDTCRGRLEAIVLAYLFHMLESLR